MKILNEANINFLSRSSNESYARMATAGFFAQLDPTVEDVYKRQCYNRAKRP